MPLTVATCQFPMSANIESNRQYISKQMKRAHDRGAQVVQFPECALSGYADTTDYTKLNWTELETATRAIVQRAGELGVWVLLGSVHRLTGKHKPHNSLYIINASGEIVNRYDKRFCFGRADDPESELASYTPGDHPCVFEIAGVRCGTLICHEYRYPELYREYKKLGVDLVFHSYYTGNFLGKELREMQQTVGKKYHHLNPGKTLPEITMPAGMHSRAADNYMWISCSNTSKRESSWPSFVVRPDGVLVGRLRRNIPGVLITKIDPSVEYYNSTAPWRDRAMTGQLHSGTLVKDKRSENRQEL
jgi:deaminated glutathione amidase